MVGGCGEPRAVRLSDGEGRRADMEAGGETNGSLDRPKKRLKL